MISRKMSDIIFDMMSDMPVILDMKYELNYTFFFSGSPLNTKGNNIIFMINHVGILLEGTIQANVTTGAGQGLIVPPSLMDTPLPILLLIFGFLLVSSVLTVADTDEIHCSARSKSKLKNKPSVWTKDEHLIS